MGVSFLVGGSGSFRVPCLRNKCYVTLFRYATFVVRSGCGDGGNNSPKSAVRDSKRPKITPRLVIPHNTCLLLSGLAGRCFAPFLASSL